MANRSMQRTPRGSLNRDRVLAAALNVADSEGLNELTIRKVAQRLDASPMAIYRHVADKQDMISGLMDVVIGEFIDLDSGPRELDRWLHYIFGQMRTALVAHPGVMPLIGTAASSGPNSLLVVNEVIGRLLAAGIKPDRAAHAFYSLISFTIGIVAIECGSQAIALDQADRTEAETTRRRLSTANRDTLPHITTTAEHLARFDVDHIFREGLATLISDTI